MTAAVTYFGDNFYQPMPESVNVGQEIVREFAYTLGAALAINDLIKLCAIPGDFAGGIVLDDYYIDLPDMDTSTGWAIDVGDEDTAAKFVSNSTKGQAPAIVTAAV